jgi:ATP/maltotriose-dependent transcriptional regulator MalT
MTAVSMHWIACRATAAAADALAAADHARDAGDDGLVSRALGWYLWTTLKGKVTSAAALRREVDALERDQTGMYLAAFIEFVRGELARLQGEFGEARRLIELAIDHFQAMRIQMLAAACYQGLAETELSAGQPAAAVAWLLKADAGLTSVGESAYRSTVQAILARIYELLGDRDAARAAIALSDELTPPQDRINYTITHAVRARLALAEGDGDTAVRWIRSAVEHAFATDFPLYQARAELELAHVLAALGDLDQAISAARKASELYEAKGDRPGVAEAQTLHDELSTSSRFST